MGNSFVTVLGFQLEPGRDSLQGPFFNKDEEKETEQETSKGRVSQAVEEWYKYGKCETMLTKRECRCCHKTASH